MANKRTAPEHNEAVEAEQAQADEVRANMPAAQRKALEATEERRNATTGHREVGPDGSELTQFEVDQNARFEDQNELEARIDDAGADQPQFDAAGNPTTVNAEELLVGSATVTNYPGLQINPYPPTDFAYVLVAGDITADPELTTRGFVAGDAAPPENNFADLRETDNVNDTKDFMRRYRAPNDAIVAANRNKYPSGIEAPS